MCLSLSFDPQDAHSGRKELTLGSCLPFGLHHDGATHMNACMCARNTVNHTTVCLAILWPHTLCLGHLLISSRKISSKSEQLYELLFTPVKKQLNKGFILTQQSTWRRQEWEAAAHTVSSQEGEGWWWQQLVLSLLLLFTHPRIQPTPQPSYLSYLQKLPQTCRDVSPRGLRTPSS